MSGLVVSISPREIAASLRATCSDVSLDARICYAVGPVPMDTPVQRRIGSFIQLPSPAWMVRLGGLEMSFADGERLSAITLYGNVLNAEQERLPCPATLTPVWLRVPGFDHTDDDVFSVQSSIRVGVDRVGRAVRVHVSDMEAPDRAFSLASGLEIRLDPANRLTDLIFSGIEWITGDPVTSAS